MPEQGPGVKSDENKFATVGCATLFVVVAAVLFVLVLRPFRGAAAQSLDVWPRAYWMVTHFNDEAAFPPKSNLCAEPFCRRTDAELQYVGGNPGHMSESKLRFCSDHTPGLPKTGTRYDDALRFVYWIMAMGLSFVAGIALPLLAFGLLELAARHFHRDSATPWQQKFGKGVKAMGTVVILVLAAVTLAWAAAWVMFAWW